MLSLEDELEFEPQYVTRYCFVDEKETPLSFAVLPFCYDEVQMPNVADMQVFVHGKTDNGLRSVYKQVTAWKLNLQHERPEFFVLCKERKWLKLLKPMKSYKGYVRTILVTALWLHVLKRNPETSEKRLWDCLFKVFSSFDVQPSANDLRNHLTLIKSFADNDETLSKSQLMILFLKDNLLKRSSSFELVNSDRVTKEPFIASGGKFDESMGVFEGDLVDANSGLFDSVCAICHNGGEILFCEGGCLRSFHATRDAGIDSNCKTLGYSRPEVEAMEKFVCKNCCYRQHQCFVCGQLGCSDKSVGAEVFRCASAECCHFYHPQCVAQWVFPEEKAEAIEYRERIVAGETFVCPVHKCHVCRQSENKRIKELQFAICARCPKSYHRKCLPSDIPFENLGYGSFQRAWEDLLPDRILIYCIKHKIEEKLRTPIRNHIVFPDTPDRKDINFVPDANIVKHSAMVAREYVPHPIKKAKVFMRSGSSDLRKDNHVSILDNDKILWKESPKGTVTSVLRRPISENKKIPLNDNHKVAVLAVRQNTTRELFNSSFPVVDCETEKRMFDLINKASFELTLEDVISKRTIPSTHVYNAKQIDQSITLAKVEGSIEAIRTALLKIENGTCVEDAKVVCEPEVLQHVHKWRQQFKVYLAPFLLGTRYTSFGRHFTKVEKLKEIVEKLQWYVQDGDTIVDFCCGANDFSRLMNEKLEIVGKKASFRNYDLLQPKDDFNFEQRDWMTVQLEELPEGSKLIMGLNPPFGVKASLANAFIDKALTFKPKLLILIVPKETKRLDRKHPPYDLIWEDDKKLSGKSFYLPGSIDLEDQQLEQWNLKPPPLSLWSRSDWTVKHQEITIRYNLMPVDCNSAATQNGCAASPCGWRNVQKKIKSYKKSVRFKDVVGVFSTNKSSRESISPSIARSEASELPSPGEINRSSAKLPTEGHRQMLGRLYGRRATADPSPLNDHVGGESDIAMDKVASPPL
ncbi:Histone-lysine N-methyltransferase protein [Dioscorea alata]|uniref:Histone-lysine N-methyltransferase protein n=1 Tax=Dioscorea alata TaxID=55571 RepID=A0ACB7VIY5_DIOAL|nr:Histone-lysine N-methyltransferase protein [Dioscorea alata]